MINPCLDGFLKEREAGRLKKTKPEDFEAVNFQAGR
jgi:hypothetical protein